MTPAEMIGYGLAAVTAIGGFIINRRKADIDESAVILSKWKELFERHEAAMDKKVEEFEAYKKTAMEEIEALRKRLAAAEARIAALEEENRQLRVKNEGLMRTVAQKSQSVAVVLAPVVGDKAPTAKARFAGEDDFIARLDKAGHNKGVEE